MTSQPRDAFAPEAPGRHDYVLIGNPVAHSLSPAMHNALYRELAKERWFFTDWRYAAVCCETEEEAIGQINLVRTGRYRGMNVTMPYKRLALEQATYVDAAADSAGGANVLLRKGYDLYAYNTDGLGALGAVKRWGGVETRGKRVAVFGTGPTSMAIVSAFAQDMAAQIVLFSRDEKRAKAALERVRVNLEQPVTFWLSSASYDVAADAIPDMDIVIDATPCGMHPGDRALVDTALLREGQVVMDVVYGHGETELLAGARRAGAVALDGLGMLVEQAALSVEIWTDALSYPLEADREIMRQAAINASR